MYILGLNLRYDSTAFLLKDWKIIGYVSEENFNKIKNCFCFLDKYGTSSKNEKYI